MRSIFLLIFVLIIVGAGIYTYNEVGKSSTQENIEELPSLDGSWVMEDASKPMQMRALILNETIQVDFHADEMDGLYWAGSFRNEDAKPPFVTSEGDIERMSRSIFASRAEEKNFKYEDGKLSFERTIAGVTETIYLVRE